MKLLEGKTVNLRIEEKEDLPLGAEWLNNPDVLGEYEGFTQISKSELEKRYSEARPEQQTFVIEKKDGSKIGLISHFPMDRVTTLSTFLIPTERGKGYCSEATQILVDFLFLSKDIARIQVIVNNENKPSQRVVEKCGFLREGTLRRYPFIRGRWRDSFLYSIIKEEWKEPKTLARAVQHQY
jgi:ribosomal-protein-alanine N-acetyltransferase